MARPYPEEGSGPMPNMPLYICICGVLIQMHVIHWTGPFLRGRVWLVSSPDPPIFRRGVVRRVWPRETSQVRQLVQRNYRRDKVHTLQLEGYRKLDFMLLQAASSGECSYYRYVDATRYHFTPFFLLVNHTYPSVLWEFCYNTQL